MVGVLVADRADDGAGDAAHDVRAVAELLDFLEDGGLFLLRDVRFQDNDHIFLVRSGAGFDKKTAGV